MPSMHSLHSSIHSLIHSIMSMLSLLGRQCESSRTAYVPEVFRSDQEMCVEDRKFDRGHVQCQTSMHLFLVFVASDGPLRLEERNEADPWHLFNS